MNASALEARGVIISYSEVWSGEPGKDRRSEPDPTRVRSVFVNLTPADWCSVAMRDGDQYMGGCCGTMSAFQDVINGIFRDGGDADASDLYKLGHYAKAHPDGFELWNRRMTQAKFDAACGRWDELPALDKLGLVWQAVRDKVKPYSHVLEPIVQEDRPDLDETREMDELFNSLYLQRYSSFQRGTEDKNGQHAANAVHEMAKAFPGAKKLYERLQSDFTSWSGFALVESKRPAVVCHNSFGLCLYNTREDAEEVLRLLDRDERSEKQDRSAPQKGARASELMRIRPATVSVQRGVELGD